MSFSSPSGLLYCFVASLIVYNCDFVHPFSVKTSSYRFLSRAQLSILPRSQLTQIYSDADEYGSSDESDSKIFRDDLDDEILEDDNAEDEENEDEEEGDDEEDVTDADGLTNSWQERRLTMNAERDRKAAAVRAKLSWEEKFEDDPLRADNPTKALEEETEPYEKIFVAIGEISGNEMLSKRSTAWVHHMQWARRSALLPNAEAKIKWEYTRLSQDCMGPIGQVLGIKANSSAEVRALLTTEPLSVTGGISGWRLFEFNQLTHENTTWDLRDPRLFLGFDADGAKSNDQYESLLEEHTSYHVGGGRLSTIDPVQSAIKGEPVMIQHPIMNHKRAILMGRLIADDGEHSNGTMILFNAKTNADAERYIALDPLMKSKHVYDKKKVVISPVNEQDVDGLNHMMARTFGEKTVLDQVHFMDPEDLLDLEVEELPGLEGHATANMDVLKALDTLDVSYRYTRLTMAERYGGLVEAEGYAQRWNKKLEGTQKIRMSSAVDQESVDEDSLVAAVSEDDSSSSTADSSND